MCKSTGCALLVLLSKACVIGVCSSLEEAIRTKAATHGTLPFLLLFFLNLKEFSFAVHTVYCSAVESIMSLCSSKTPVSFG